MSDRAAIASGFATLRALIPEIQQAAHDELHTDTFAVWEVDREADWADSTDVEAQRLVALGTGKLREQGAGGPQGTEQVIHLESPFVFRALASAPITAGNLLVVNGARLFRVDLAKREGDDDLLMNVYVTELHTTPMPGVS